MLDVDAFLTTLYVLIDDFCKNHLPGERRPGPAASLSRSEVLTLAIFAQWGRFPSERAFWRYAHRQLRPLFPRMPHRSQFNRQVRHYGRALVAVIRLLVERLGATAAPYEALDTSAVPVRNAKRRGEGWLCGLADLGWSNRLGWYEGFSLLFSATPEGVLTGYGFGAASTREPQLADVFFAERSAGAPRLPWIGQSRPGCYLTDKGFESGARHRRWREAYGVRVLTPPRRSAHAYWPRELRRWIAGLRQIAETVSEKLHDVFRLDRERPHALDGFHARLAATVALHNVCIWLNRQLGRPNLAFADLIAW